MINTYNLYDIRVKENFARIQKLAGLLIIASCFLSLGYFVFWLGAISDDVFFEYGRPYFEPLAAYLNLGDTSKDIYINTSLYMLFAIVPVLFFQYVSSKLEEAFLTAYKAKEERKLLKERKEEQKSYLARFDSIQTYSICLSLDYETRKDKKPISEHNKKILNNTVYSKIADLLKRIEPNSKVVINDVLIFTSHNFANYDNIYDSILDGLSHIKKIIESKYSYNLIPSMTTDAFSDELTSSSIRKQHYEIQSFNFKNRALATATFANKYKHLKHNKYAGIPIGEYAYFTNAKMDTYELNVVYKNLALVLNQMS